MDSRATDLVQICAILLHLATASLQSLLSTISITLQSIILGHKWMKTDRQSVCRIIFTRNSN